MAITIYGMLESLQVRIRHYMVSNQDLADCLNGTATIDRSILPADATVQCILTMANGTSGNMVFVRSEEFDVVSLAMELPETAPLLPLKRTTWRDRGPML